MRIEILWLELLYLLYNKATYNLKMYADYKNREYEIDATTCYSRELKEVKKKMSSDG